MKLHFKRLLLSAMLIPCAVPTAVLACIPEGTGMGAIGWVNVDQELPGGG